MCQDAWKESYLKKEFFSIPNFADQLLFQAPAVIGSPPQWIMIFKFWVKNKPTLL